MAGKPTGIGPATKRKYTDMQKYFAKRSAIMETIGRRQVRKHSDDRIVAELMDKFYFDSEARVWEILKKQLD